MYRVVIADDHEIVRQGLRRLLASRDAAIVGEAASARDLLTVLRRERHVDVVVADLALDDLSGIELMKQLHAEFPAVPVVVFAASSDEPFALRLLRAGAAGYVTKRSASDVLLSAIDHAVRGERFVSADISARVTARIIDAGDRPRHELLSDREFEVLRGLSTGSSPTELAARLHLSVKTISTYRRRILQKLDLSSNAEMVRYAIEHELI
jgi:two-component system invasion response regulator UvrY